ncbi:CCDC90 family protein [Methylocapsa aurea]|uniref:CCDC90 family protein n=1 Tax=Methylocapsa aurea TaxID=663610 RepID=UPI001FD90BE0|nr:CCDC90 family protein [Methylocapsa aurea]
MDKGALCNHIGGMSAIPFDTLRLARSLREKAHFTPEQAEGVADALADAFQDQVATKDDLTLLEHRLTIKIGGMLVVSIGVLTALVKGLP